MGEMNANYHAVLADLEAKKDRLTKELKIVGDAIAGIRSLMGAAVVHPPAFVSPVGWGQMAQPITRAEDRFADISVRWAVLWLLSEADHSMRTADIVEALRDGGYPQKSPNFSNAVSAVLSNMKGKGEVSGLGEYALTETGRAVWNGIRNSQTFRKKTEVPQLFAPVGLSD
jgi:hypothetical protein